MNTLITSPWIASIRLFACLILGGSALGQTNVLHSRIVCDEPLFDFGVRPNSVEVDHDFIIRNLGNAPLVITQVRSGCGCTRAQISQNTIEPGSNTVLSTRLTLRGIVGLKRTNIYLHTNDPEKTVFQCQLAGTAVTDLSVTPSQLTFNYTPLTLPSPQHLIVTSQNSSKAKITNLESDGHFFQASIETNMPGYGVILVTPSSNTPVETMQGMVIISTDHPRFPRLTVPVQTLITRDLNAYPAEIVLKSGGHENQENIRYIILRNHDEQPFNVTNVVVIPPVFPARIHSTKSAWARLKVGPFTPDTVGSGAVVRVYIDKPGG